MSSATARPFELHAIGGPWGRRLAPRRAWLDELPWPEGRPLGDGERAGLDEVTARRAWTETVWTEYASAAAFADIAGALLACNAPIDLVAAAGDFVVDELVHTEAAARVAAALGGAVTLEVSLDRLVRPAQGRAPLVAAAERLVRTSCVGEALTVPLLKQTRRDAGTGLIAEVVARVVADEAGHAQLGWWFLDWAAPRLDDGDRAHLGRVAGATVRSFVPLLTGDAHDRLLAAAIERHVVRPLAARGIEVPAADLAAVGVGVGAADA